MQDSRRQDDKAVGTAVAASSESLSILPWGHGL